MSCFEIQNSSFLFLTTHFIRSTRMVVNIINTEVVKFVLCASVICVLPNVKFSPS